jgi:hypothetical protein
MRVTARRLIRGTSHRSQMQVTNRRRRAVALSLQPSGPALSPRRPRSLASSLLSSFQERDVASLLRRRLLATLPGRSMG